MSESKNNVIIKIKLPSGKIPAIGMGLEEIIAAGLGLNSTVSLQSAKDFLGNIFSSTHIAYKETINGYTSTAHTGWIDIIKSIDGGVGSLDQSPTYHRLVEETTEAFVPYARAITFDSVNLVGDLLLIKISKGKYRKVMIIKTGTDGMLLTKDVFLYWHTKETIKNLFLSIQKGAPYENRQAILEVGKDILFNKIFPYLDKAEAIGNLQLPINVAISVGVGIGGLIWAYRSERKERLNLEEYVTSVV